MIAHLRESMSAVRWLQVSVVLGIIFASQLFLFMSSYWGDAVDYVQGPAVKQFSEHDDANVAICMAVKDQGQDLREFLRHHYYNIGIKHFYVMDDGSLPTLESVGDHNYYGVPKEVITFRYFSEEEKATLNGDRQHIYYNLCNGDHGKKHDWLGFLDTDEFVGTFTNLTFSDVLRPLTTNDTVGALGLNWRVATSNGHLTRVPETRKGYTECIWDDPLGEGHDSDNRHIKSFVKTKYYAYPGTVHNFITSENTITVGELGDRVDGPWRYNITREYVGLYHYAIKSKEEYQQKIDRGNAENAPKSWSFWDHIDVDMPKVPCWEMARYDI